MFKNIFYIIFVPLSLLIISCEREVSVSEPYDFEVGNAQYFISTIPSGAAIFVDDKNTGLFTPDTVRWLSEGSHNFVLKMEPYLDYSFSGEAENDDLKETKYSFLDDPKNFGSLKFSSLPEGCDIYFNDSLMPYKTPYIMQSVLPAKYKVKYSFPEHRSDSTSVFVYAGKQAFVNMELPDTSVWVTYDTDNSFLTENTVNGLEVDSENNLWIGTWHNGLIKLKYNSYEYINTSNSNLPNDIINNIKFAPDGRLWVATFVGLAVFNGEIINSFRKANSGLPDNFISGFDFDSKGNVWIGTQKGLTKFDGTSWETYTTSNSKIPGNFITAVAIAENDSVWIGTNQFNTSKLIDRENWIVYQSDSLLLGDAVADIIVGNDNNIWTGLISQPTKNKPGGVYKIMDGKMEEIFFSIPNKRINRFYRDNENTIWIGTRSGVIAVDPSGSYKLYTASNTGLPNNDILSIAKDLDGNMWFGTNGRGLVKYKKWNE